MASLLGLSRAAFDRSKRYTSWTQSVRVFGLFGALTGVVLPASAGSASSLLAVFALILECTAWWLSYLADRAHELAEQARRRNLLIDAFGETKENLDLTDLLESFGPKLAQAAESLEESAYFASERQHGLERFIDHLQESAFWTKHLYRKCADRALSHLLMKLAAVIVALVASIFVGAYDPDHLMAKATIVALSTVLALGELDQLLNWRDGARVAEFIDRRLENLDANNEESLYAIWGDYNAMVEKVPVIPDKVYGKEKAWLNQQWAVRTKQASS